MGGSGRGGLVPRGGRGSGGSASPRATGPGVAAGRGLGGAPMPGPGPAGPSGGGGARLSVLWALLCAGVRPPCPGEAAAFLVKKEN